MDSFTDLSQKTDFNNFLQIFTENVSSFHPFTILHDLKTKHNTLLYLRTQSVKIDRLSHFLITASKLQLKKKKTQTR